MPPMRIPRLLLLLALSACSRSPMMASDKMVGPAPRYCVDVQYNYFGGRPARGRFCFAERRHCRHARSNIIRFGSMGKVTGVGKCTY